MKTLIRIGSGRVVAMRYRMKNSQGEVLINTLEGEPVTFLYGSGEILPGLEKPLSGLKIGEQKSFGLSAEAVPQFGQTMYFDVIIDDIRWPAGNDSPTIKSTLDNTADICGPGCDC
jgi:FKBP-type peptidyl-prolyl cis-trans isomerase SlyD